MLRAGIPRPTGNMPESLGQAILVGIILAGRLGVRQVRLVFVQQASGRPAFVICRATGDLGTQQVIPTPRCKKTLKHTGKQRIAWRQELGRGDKFLTAGD